MKQSCEHRPLHHHPSDKTTAICLNCRNVIKLIDGKWSDPQPAQSTSPQPKPLARFIAPADMPPSEVHAIASRLVGEETDPSEWVSVEELIEARKSLPIDPMEAVSPEYLAEVVYERRKAKRKIG